MRSKRHKLAGDESVVATVTGNAQGRTHLKRGEVERSQGVQDDDFVGGISVDGVVEREVRGVVVEGQVEGRAGSREGVSKTGNPFLKETFSLGSSDGRTETLVVVKRQIVVVFVVGKVLRAEERAEGGVADGIGFVRAELEHGNGVGGSEGQVASDFGVEAGESGVEGVVGECSGGRATDAATAGNVGVGAGFVSSTGVVDAASLDENLNVDLVHVLWDAEETSGKVLGGLDHSVLGLCAEDGKGFGGCEVVEELTVQLTILNTELEVLTAAERSQKLSTELVSPVGKETKLAGGLERVASLGCVGNLGGKGGRSSA